MRYGAHGRQAEVKQVAKTSMSYSPRFDTILEAPALQFDTEQARRALPP
jgi:hypothetical protein